MKAFNIFLLFLFLVFNISCSPDNKTVADYKYGVITKGEVKRRAMGVKLNPQLEKAIIESLVVEGIARHDALAGDFDKNEIFILRLERESWPLLKKIVNDKSSGSLNLSWEYVKCRHIVFSGGNSPDVKENALSRAKNTIELLKKGAKFDSLIKSYSTNPQNAVEASTLYIVKGGGMPEFENAAFSLPIGTYSKEPVILPGGMAAIIISDETGTLTLGNLEKKIKSPDEKKRLSLMLERMAYSKLIFEIEKNNNASFKVAVLPDKENEVIFSVSGKDYTLKELKKKRDVFSAIIREPLENREFLLGFAREWYFYELYKSEAAIEGYLNDKKFIMDMKSSTDFILANEYIRYLCEKEITVSEEDMFEEYSKNKNKYMKRPGSKSKKPLQLSYNEAKIFIKKKLIQTQLAAAVEEWKKRALADSGLVIRD